MKLSRRHLLAAAAATALSKPADAATPASTRVTVAGIEFDPADSAALVQPAGPDTTRIFLRKGPWAVIWYVQARSPVDGKAFDVVVVERQRWTGLTSARNAVNYAAQAFGKSFNLKGHGDFQRWVATSRDWPLHDRTLDEWMKKGWLLPWGIGPKLVFPGVWPWMYEVPPYQPLHHGSMNYAMGTAGLRDDIGPIMQTQARYVMERTDELRTSTMRHGLTTASIAWHVRGQDGLPLLLDKPGSSIALKQYYQNLPPENIISTSIGMLDDWTIDNSHRPCGAFLPALLTGLHPFFVEQQVFSACSALNTVSPGDRGPSSLLIDTVQGRDFAWSMRDMVLAHGLLTRLPPLAWLPAPKRFEAILSANLDRALAGMAAPGRGAFGMFWPQGDTDIKPNPTVWAGQQNNAREGLYQGSVADFIGYTLDWGRRLHGDPRWLKLHLLFAQRFQAPRVLALGPYAFLPVPVRLAGRWARDWAEVARSVKLARLSRWHSFDVPLDDKAIFPYGTEYPVNLYHSLKLADASGQAGPVVARAIAYLEQEMQPGAKELWPAFALRH
jgi:hypothetical protein